MKKQVTQEELKSYEKFYDKNAAYKLLKKLRKTSRDKKLVNNVAGKIVETLGTLISALDNPKTPIPMKALIVSAIGYIILPIDLMPDFMPFFVGYTDDVLSAAVVVGSCKQYSTFNIETLDKEIDEDLGIDFDDANGATPEEEKIE